MNKYTDWRDGWMEEEEEGEKRDRPAVRRLRRTREE